MNNPAFSNSEKDLIRQTAFDSIAHGLRRHESLPVVVGDFPPALQAPGACFVTLHRHGELRGCIGTTEAYRPLIQDVAGNAYAASRHDPRFPVLTDTELPDVVLSVSVLTPPEPMTFRDEDDLLDQLQPGRDGLIIEDGAHRATFLPQVWQQLPDPHDFLGRLKQKAGLTPRRRPRALRAHRYRVVEISRDD